MEKFTVLKFYKFCVIFALCGWFAGIAHAQTITLHTNGQEVSGEILDMKDEGIRLKMPDGTFMEKPIPWGQLTQDDLKALRDNNPKAAPFVEPFIEIPRAEKLQRTQVDIKPVPKLDRPARQSLFGALGTSSAGLLMLLFLYAGNLYAAYEISIFRAQPLGLVCGVSAVLPVLGPIIFLSMPTRLRQAESSMASAPDENLEAAMAAEQAAPAATHAHSAPRHPTTQHLGAAAEASAGRAFLRGQFTFNRRFFETQMPGFFAVIRPNADKDTLLIIKSARGTHTVQRISRITPNELYIQAQKGNASEEIVIPFNDIQEVHLKPKVA